MTRQRRDPSRADCINPGARPYRLKPASLGGVLPGLDLTKALQVAASLEDEEIARKLELRK